MYICLSTHLISSLGKHPPHKWHKAIFNSMGFQCQQKLNAEMCLNFITRSLGLQCEQTSCSQLIYQHACKSQKTSFQRSNQTPEFNLSEEGELTESVFGVLAGLSLPFTIHFNTIRLILFFRWKSCSEKLWTKVQMPHNRMKGCKKCIKPSMVLTVEGSGIQGWGHESNAWYWHIISVLYKLNNLVLSIILLHMISIY